MRLVTSHPLFPLLEQFEQQQQSRLDEPQSVQPVSVINLLTFTNQHIGDEIVYNEGKEGLIADDGMYYREKQINVLLFNL